MVKPLFIWKCPLVLEVMSHSLRWFLSVSHRNYTWVIMAFCEMMLTFWPHANNAMLNRLASALIYWQWMDLKDRRTEHYMKFKISPHMLLKVQKVQRLKVIGHFCDVVQSFGIFVLNESCAMFSYPHLPYSLYWFFVFGFSFSSPNVEQ